MFKHFKLRKAEKYDDIWYINRQALFLITIKYQTILSVFKSLYQNDLQSGVDDLEFLGCELYMLINCSVFKFSAYLLLKFCFNSMIVPISKGRAIQKFFPIFHFSPHNFLNFNIIPLLYLTTKIWRKLTASLRKKGWKFFQCGCYCIRDKLLS